MGSNSLSNDKDNTNNGNPGHSSPGEDDATEVNNPDTSPPPGSSDSDVTEYLDAEGNQSVGFDTARQLARDAKNISGRLLKERFVLEDVMGEGGMGRVYRARDLRKVEAEDKNPYVAIKVLSQTFREHPNAFVALQQEAVKSQKLAHPNIVTVHDFDRDGNTIFMTMELLKGDPLDRLLTLEAPFSKEVALRYFRDLCNGLEYAHERGLVHSDFKPGNIFVSTAGTVKILDFGIARAVSSNVLSHDYDAGSLGALTPAYATVEMVEGQAPSFSDDIYALACVLYIMLTGEHPFQRKSAAEAREQGLVATQPQSLDKREWQVLKSALSFTLGERPATIEAFRDGMLPPKRSKQAGLAIAGVVTVAVIAVGAFLLQQQQAAEEQAANLEQRLAAARDCFINQDYGCVIENALVVRNLQPDNAEAERLLARAEKEQAEQQQAAQQAATIAAALDEADNCLAAGDLDCAERALAEAEQAGASAAQMSTARETWSAALAAKQADIQQQQARVDDLLAEAGNCMEQRDFACTDSTVAAVLELDPGNIRAVEMRQAVTTARNVQLANEKVVAGFLAEAESCFARKDYSCTIAKSESALAIVPGHPEARAAVERARQAQAEAKRSITIN